MNEAVLQKRPRGRPRTQPLDQPAGTVQALDRALTLLRALTRQGHSNLTDLALSTGMPPSSTHRILSTLQKHGFVEFDETGQEWFIGIEAFRVGSAYLVRTNLVEVALKVMRTLTNETEETTNLAIVDNDSVVFVSQVETHNPIRAFFRPGTRSPMHASGIGKALLAHMNRGAIEKILQKTGLPEFTEKTLTRPEDLFADLEKTRERGWAFDDEERYTGMRCVAAAVHDAHGEAIAGISISGPTVRFPDHVVAEIGPKVRSAAASITTMIAGSFPDR